MRGITATPKPASIMRKIVVVWPTSCATLHCTPSRESTSSINRRLPDAWSSSTSDSPFRSVQCTVRLLASRCVGGQASKKGSVRMVSQVSASRSSGSITTPKSTSPESTLSSVALCTRSSSMSSRPGCCAWQRAMHSGMRLAERVGLLATRTRPRLAVAMPATSCSVESRSSSTRGRRAARLRPASVNSTSRVVRLTSCRPS